MFSELDARTSGGVRIPIGAAVQTILLWPVWIVLGGTLGWLGIAVAGAMGWLVGRREGWWAESGRWLWVLPVLLGAFVLRVDLERFFRDPRYDIESALVNAPAVLSTVYAASIWVTRLRLGSRGR